MTVVCCMQLKFFVKENLVSVHELKHEICFFMYLCLRKKFIRKHFIKKTCLNGYFKITMLAALLEFL